MELFRIKKDIPFMSYGRLTTTISLITFIIAVLFLSIKGLNLGVDFTGGTLMEVSYSHPADIDKIRQVMDKIDLKDTTVQNFGTSKDVLIRLPIRQDLSIAQLSEKVSAALIESDKDTKIQRVESVGSQVGEELYANGALALLLVCFGIIAYLALRFEWRFAVAAIIANMHDVIIILGWIIARYSLGMLRSMFIYISGSWPIWLLCYVSGWWGSAENTGPLVMAAGPLLFMICGWLGWIIIGAVLGYLSVTHDDDTIQI